MSERRVTVWGPFFTGLRRSFSRRGRRPIQIAVVTAARPPNEPQSFVGAVINQSRAAAAGVRAHRMYRAAASAGRYRAPPSSPCGSSLTLAPVPQTARRRAAPAAGGDDRLRLRLRLRPVRDEVALGDGSGVTRRAGVAPAGGGGGVVPSETPRWAVTVLMSLTGGGDV